MKNILISAVLAIIFSCSCDPDRVFEKNIKIPDGVWLRENLIHFDLLIEDTISPHNLYVNVRNTSLYPVSNLYLFITTTAPSGHSVKDTVEVTLADSKGKWLGSGLGDIWDIQQVYKKNVRFAQRGIYNFEFQQAMRIDKLPFILDVGLRVDKSE